VNRTERRAPGPRDRCRGRGQGDLWSPARDQRCEDDAECRAVFVTDGGGQDEPESGGGCFNSCGHSGIRRSKPNAVRSLQRNDVAPKLRGKLDQLLGVRIFGDPYARRPQGVSGQCRSQGESSRLQREIVVVDHDLTICALACLIKERIDGPFTNAYPEAH